MHPEQQRDIEHLSMLSIFHYVVGAFTLLMALLPLVYVLFGVAFLNNSFGGTATPPAEIGYFLIAFGLMASVLVALYALLILRAGRMLAMQRSYLFCMVAAVLLVIAVPFGTVLGIFSIIVLARPGVKYLFGHPPYDKLGSPYSVPHAYDKQGVPLPNGYAPGNPYSTKEAANNNRQAPVYPPYKQG